MNEIHEIVVSAMPHQQVRIQWLNHAGDKTVCETVHSFPGIGDTKIIPVKNYKGNNL